MKGFRHMNILQTCNHKFKLNLTQEIPYELDHLCAFLIFFGSHGSQITKDERQRITGFIKILPKTQLVYLETQCLFTFILTTK